MSDTGLKSQVIRSLPSDEASPRRTDVVLRSIETIDQTDDRKFQP